MSACRKARKLKNLKTPPFAIWATDTLERVRGGIKRHVLTLIDPVSRIVFACALPAKMSRHTAAVAQAVIEGLSDSDAKTRQAMMFLSDNGAECQSAFDQALSSLGLSHYWIYLKFAKMDATANAPACQ